MQKIKELTIYEEQIIQMEILHFFNEICIKENLKYYSAYGTLLGAVREKGFISWDDDIDIWMPRCDLDRFVKVFPQYANKRLFLQTVVTDPQNVTPEMVRICVNGTYKWKPGNESEKFHTGLFFDIFPLDYGYGNSRDNNDIKFGAMCHKILMRTLDGRNNAQANRIKKLLATIERRLTSKAYCRMIDKHKSCDSCTYLAFGAAFAGKCKSVFEKTYFDNIVYLQFEDMCLPCPEKYDELLTYMYGSYMTPTKTKPTVTAAYLVE